MDKLLWIDLEMTGLDVQIEVIIEVAAIVTDLKLKELEVYHSIVKQPNIYLDNMDDWNTKHHTESGLISQVPTGKEPEVVEQELIALADRHFKNERVIIAGNTIGQDRLFIDQYFGDFAKKLHYRMLDVTAWKIIYENVFAYKFRKTNAHRAVDDIRESIAELKSYMSFIKVDPEALGEDAKKADAKD